VTTLSSTSCRALPRRTHTMRGNLRPRVAIGLPGSGCGVSRTAPPELRQLLVGFGLHPTSGHVGRCLEAGMRSFVDLTHRLTRQQVNEITRHHPGLGARTAISTGWWRSAPVPSPNGCPPTQAVRLVINPPRQRALPAASRVAKRANVGASPVGQEIAEREPAAAPGRKHTVSNKYGHGQSEDHRAAAWRENRGSRRPT
jgi:hypothetical protein